MASIPEAVVLSGSIGQGHEMLSRACGDLFERSGWRTRSLNSMALLGHASGRAGERLFGRLVAVPGIYDGLHFAHLRTGSRLAERMDDAAAARLVPALRTELEDEPADLVLSVFATGASAAARLKAEAPRRRTVVLCPDVAVHRLWVRDGTDLFLVTSPAAAAHVRRFLPRAKVSVVAPPVRDEFYAAPTKEEARAALGLPTDEPCVLLIDSGWGFGPLVDSVATLADAGVHVLAVAGHHAAVERRLRSLAQTCSRVTPFGFTNRVPDLMAASDLVVALPGSTTCSEARVVGRPLLLLDVMPGHGRDNLLHELETGGAQVCGPSPAGVAASALALIDEGASPLRAPGPAPRWEPSFVAALERIGVELRPRPDETSLITGPVVTQHP